MIYEVPGVWRWKRKRGAVLPELRRGPAPAVGHCGAELSAGGRFCPSCGQPVLATPPEAKRPAGASSAGERKQVTMLLADFSGFTAFSAKRDPEEVRDCMTSLWTRLDAVIAGHGGMVEKHIGDAIMAVFGARQSREDDPEQAVRAALAMRTALTESAAGAPPPFELRVGVHTGPAVVGPLGARAAFSRRVHWAKVHNDESDQPARDDLDGRVIESPHLAGAWG